MFYKWQILFILPHLFLQINADIEIISPAKETVEYIDNDSDYGALPLDGLTGKVVLSNPEDACKQIVPAPNQTENWFLLTKLYTCPFEVKLKNAALAGYHALIVYNDISVKRTHLLNSHNLPVELQRPAVLVSFQDGNKIKTNYLYDKGFTARITPSYFNNPYLLPFAIVIILCIFLMVSFLIFQVIKCARDRRKLQRHRLNKKQLSQLLTTSYTKGGQYDTCAVCLEDYAEGERLRVLPCGHCYHSRCIDQWLTKQKATCCVCKTKVRVPGMAAISDSESDSEAPIGRHSTYYNESTSLLHNQRHNQRYHNNDSLSIDSI